MLEVVVHRDHDVARGVGQAAERRPGLALVVHEVKPLHLRVRAGERAYDLPRVVGRAVVDEDDLVVARLRTQCICDRSSEIPEPAPGAVDGNDDRYPSESGATL